MPRWNYDEIELCRRMLFEKLDQSLVQELFRRWGGIPRFVLSRPFGVYRKYLI